MRTEKNKILSFKSIFFVVLFYVTLQSGGISYGIIFNLYLPEKLRLYKLREDQGWEGILTYGCMGSEKVGIKGDYNISNEQKDGVNEWNVKVNIKPKNVKCPGSLEINFLANFMLYNKHLDENAFAAGPLCKVTLTMTWEPATKLWYICITTHKMNEGLERVMIGGEKDFYQEFSKNSNCKLKRTVWMWIDINFPFPSK